MIDNLISNPMKQIWINLSCISKDMNFLIFRYFLFKIDLFELNLLKYLFLYRVLTQQVTWQRQKSSPSRGGV